LLPKPTIKSKAELLANLRKEAQALEGFKPISNGFIDLVGLPSVNQCFPEKVFPLAAVHEFFCNTDEEVTASGAFTSGLLSKLLCKGGRALWITSRLHIYPHALKQYGISPHKVIFLRLTKERDIIKAIEEALRCKALSSVVAELPELDFTISRRFQLAIEQTGVPCFLLRQKPRNVTTASVTRWQVSALPSHIEEGLPGIGFPCWKVSLLKVRNGKTGSWNLRWENGRLIQNSILSTIYKPQQKQTG